MWNDFLGSPGGPPIIGETQELLISNSYNTDPNMIYNWFSCSICALPMNVYIDHNMRVHEITESPDSYNTILSYIEEMKLLMSSCEDVDGDDICDDEDDCIGQYDECGLCNGEGIADGTCDCAGNIEDCAGECGGSGLFDECGVCNGGGIADGTCDCIGTPSITYYQDADADGLGNSNVSQEFCVTPEDGWVLNGDDDQDKCQGVIDECGVCNGDGITPGECDCDGNVEDCDGECGGSAVVDECGICNGLGIAPGECDCDGTLPDSEGDCNGLFNSTFFPSNFNINSIYPNPFNPLVNINYSLKIAGAINVSILDIYGNILEELLNEFSSAGDYEVVWDGSSFSSGLYFVVISNHNSTITKKVMLVK